MPRFFVPRNQIEGQQITLTGPDVNHIKNVLRMHSGDEISVSDGEGRDYFCRITQMDRERILVRIENSWNSYVELPSRIWLFQGLPKGDKMDMIVQKTVELGVHTIIPMITERTIMRLEPAKEEKKRARWQQIAKSAAEQSGRGVIPQIQPAVSFDTALQMAQPLAGCILPYERAEGMDASRRCIRSLHGCADIGVFIGPEGGFAQSEVKKAQTAGIETITLGRRILRTETAGPAVLSVLMFELEEN